MNFKTIDYKKWNKLLYILAVLMALLCWFFSFSKTWKLYRENQNLVRNISQDDNIYQNFNTIKQKSDKLDSLISYYTVDSIIFTINFLGNVTQAINGLPLELIYDINKQNIENNTQFNMNTFSLKGDYKSIIKALQRLEKDYFVFRILYENKQYIIYVKTLKN